MLRRFRTDGEDRLQRQIRATIARHAAELHEKVRVADIIDIDGLSGRDLGTYALQAHFDFVLIDETQKAVVAVEFDGAGHSKANDDKKDRICREANLPLIRVCGFENVREINPITLVRYLVELVFHARLFTQMKERGEIGPHEPFMLSSFLKADAEHIFDSEFDFVANANGKLTRALLRYGLASDPLPHLSISRLILHGSDDRFRAFISINSLRGPIVGTASFRVIIASQGFLADIATVMAEIAQFADGMASDDLLDKIRLIAGGSGHVVTDVAEYLEEIRALQSAGYELILGGGGNSSMADLVGAFMSATRKS